MPLFPNDLVLKVCLNEDDRSHVVPSLAALDSRGCYLVVVTRGEGVGAGAREAAKSSLGGGDLRELARGGGGGFSRTASSFTKQKQRRTGGFALPSGASQTPKAGNGNSRRGGGGFEASFPPALSLPSAAAVRPSALPPATRTVSLLSTPSPAAAKARAAAAAAVIANAKAVAAVAAAKEAQAVAAAAAAEEAVMVAKAVEAGVAVPWTWRESEVFSARGKPRVRPSGAAAAAAASSASPVQVTPAATVNGTLVPEVAGRRSSPLKALSSAEGRVEGAEDGGVDVYVWKGAHCNGECEKAKEGEGVGGRFFSHAFLECIRHHNDGFLALRSFFCTRVSQPIRKLFLVAGKITAHTYTRLPPLFF